MKTAAAIILAAATLAVAEPQKALPSGTKINCAKANAKFCMGGDIILACNGDATGEPAHCGDGLSCIESTRDAGDAVCRNPGSPLPTTSTATQTGTSTSSSAAPPTTSSTTTGTGTGTGTHSSSSSTTAVTVTTTSTPVTSATPPVTTHTKGNSTATTTGGQTSGIVTLTTTTGGKPTTSTSPNTNGAVANGAMGSLFALGLAVAALF